MIQQRTPEWFDARRGKPTGSQMWRIMATKKDGTPTAERQSYMVELLAERLTGSVEERYTTAPMQRGVDMEPIALMAYEAVTGSVTEPGYWIDCGSWGCTPDAFIAGGGMVEVKCPMTKTIVRQRCFEPEIPPEYYWQIVAQIAATGAGWCDLVYYDDRFTRLDHHMWIRRVQYSADDWAALSEQLSIFCAELDSLTRKYGTEPPAFLDKRNSAARTGAVDAAPDLVGK